MKTTTDCVVSLVAFLLLAQCGDVESNPGPLNTTRSRGVREEKPDKNKIMQDKVDSHDSKIAELESLVKSQNALIESLKASLADKEVDWTKRLDDLKVELEAKGVEQQVLGTKVEGMADAQVAIANHVQQNKNEQAKNNEELRNEIYKLRERLSDVDHLGSKSEDTSMRVRDLESEVDEILEKIWELDKSWRNNLVFYGIRVDERNPNADAIIEQKIRDIISKNMQITRDIPILKVKRSFNGPEVRGSRPITVYFSKWQDKDEILRKGQMLKGSNIYVTEEFSKRVRDHRAELVKFMKAMRKRRPTSKFVLQNDKLFVDKDIFVFNENTGRVEMASDILSTLNEVNQEINPSLIRKKSSGRQRMQKSHSNESSLHKVNDENPYYSDSPQKSPVKRHSPYNFSDQDSDHHSHYYNGGETGNGVESEDESGDYHDEEPPSSPVKRVGATIPETIPE